MRIAVVAGHFMPDVGYQEVYLSRALSRLGHDVRVITTDQDSPSARGFSGQRRHPAGLTHDTEDGYSVLRLSAAFTARSMVLARGVRRAVEDFSPGVVIAPGVGKLFSAPLLVPAKSRGYRLLVLFADNSDFWDFASPRLALSSLRAKVSQRLLKDSVYRRAVRFADRVALQTPETQAVVGASLPLDLREVLAAKQVFSPLGFDPTEFYFSPDERESNRTALGFGPDECVFVTCTRVNAKKSLERIVDAVSTLQVEDGGVRYAIAGFQGDRYGHALRSYIDQTAERSIFRCLPLLDHEQMRGLYCAADVGIWSKAAISIQEAMGTGLPLLLESKPSVQHLVQEGLNGWHFPSQGLVDAMRQARHAATLRPRELIATENRGRVSFDIIAQSLLDSVLGEQG